MWKLKVEQKYKIESLAKSDIEYVIEKYTDKAVVDKERIFFIPAQAKTLKTPTTKLYPYYDGPAGFMAFQVSGIKNKKVYASRLEILKAVKYLHVVKARLSLTSVDMSKKKKVDPSKFGILLNVVDKDHPDMSVFTSNKGFQIVETVEHTAPVEQLTQEEKDVLGAYAPDFGHPTQYMKQMSLREAEQLMPHMSADDVAWHMMHNKYAVDLHDDVRLADKHIGRREASFLLVMNKAISQSTRNNIADWLIAKAGVSFVGGPNMHTFLAAMAKQGLISKRFLSELSGDRTENEIYYNKITDPDELRKFSIAKYYHQLAHNVHTPPDVLKKIHDLDVKQSKKGGAWIPPSKDPEVKWSGTNPSMGGKPGRDYWFRYTDAMSNPNYPIADLVELYKRYRKKYHTKAVNNMASTLWGREDLPQDVMKDLMKDVGHYLLPPPAALKEEDFTAYWKLAKPQMSQQDSWSKFRDTAEHPNVTPAVLKDMLKIDLGDEQEATIKIAVKNLQAMGALDKETVVNKVKKSLKFDGPADLLHHFGAKAWNAKGIENLKFIDAPKAQVDQIKKEMVDASVHDDFTFEVMGVYNLSRSIHKDFDATAKKLGNIKEGVYHGTSMDNAAGILLSGINTNADSRTGQMFGGGFYLASSSSKAAQYASDNFSHSGMGIVFKMDAALGNNAEWKYGRPMGDDSWGSGNRDPAMEKKKKAYAKKNKIRDHEVATWHITNDSVHAKKGMALQHDEYVVKQGNQIKINQVILIHKTPKEKI